MFIFDITSNMCLANKCVILFPPIHRRVPRKGNAQNQNSNRNQQFWNLTIPTMKFRIMATDTKSQ